MEVLKQQTPLDFSGKRAHALGRNNGSESIGIRQYAGSNDAYCKFDTTQAQATTGLDANGTYTIVATRDVSGAANDITGSIGMPDEPQGTSTSVLTTMAEAGKPWQIGASGNSTASTTSTAARMYGYIHAIAIFDDLLTNDEIKQVEFYLNNKFKGNLV